MTPHRFLQPGGMQSEDARAVISRAARYSEPRAAKSGGGPLAAIAFVLTLALVVPTAFFVSAPKAHAVAGIGDTTVVIGETSPTALGRTLETAFSAVKNAITAISSITSAAANWALMIDKYVLEPIAFIESGNLLKSITAGVLDFVTGKTNGTGRPQFVTNLRGQILSVSDQQAIAFFASFGRNSNSPFAAAITSSLRTNYAQQTSLAGFFAQNQCTLSQFSPNINSFLAGDWSQGGTAAWFALTTQNQNNPYLLHERAQSELATLVANATSDQLNQLAWGQGFLSWCGGGGGASAVGQACTNSADGSTNDCPGELVCLPDVPGGKGTCQVPTAVQSDAVSQTACVNKDGTPGTIQTPGSTIKAALDKALGLNADKIVAFGNQVGPEINAILGNIGTVMNTINFATSVLGGGSSGGLASVGAAPLGGGQSALSAYANSPGYLGSSVQDAQNSGNAAAQSYNASANAAANAAVAAHDAAVSSNGGSTGSPVATFALAVDQYESAWNTISGAASAASSSVVALASCAAQASAAQSALINEIAPVFAQGVQASTTIAAARAMISKVEAEAVSSVAGAGGAYSADLQTLEAMPPTAADVAQAVSSAQATGGAATNPAGSLTVAGGTTVDQMNLLAANAAALKNACAP